MFFIKGLLTFLPAVSDVMKMDVSFIDCGPRCYDSCQVAVRCQRVKAIWIKAHVLRLFFPLFTLPLHRRCPLITAPPLPVVVLYLQAVGTKEWREVSTATFSSSKHPYSTHRSTIFVSDLIQLAPTFILFVTAIDTTSYYIKLQRRRSANSLRNAAAENGSVKPFTCSHKHNSC